MNTNVNSVFYLTQMAIPHLEATKGSIVNISSIAGGPACVEIEHCGQTWLMHGRESNLHKSTILCFKDTFNDTATNHISLAEMDKLGTLLLSLFCGTPCHQHDDGTPE